MKKKDRCKEGACFLKCSKCFTVHNLNYTQAHICKRPSIRTVLLLLCLYNMVVLYGRVPSFAYLPVFTNYTFSLTNQLSFISIANTIFVDTGNRKSESKQNGLRVFAKGSSYALRIAIQALQYETRTTKANESIQYNSPHINTFTNDIGVDFFVHMRHTNT